MDIRALEGIQVRGAPAASAGESVADVARPAVARVQSVEKPAEQQEPKEEKSNSDLQKVAEGVNAVLDNNGSHLRFVVHDKADRMMVQIRDNRTDEVIRTIPSKEMLDLAAKISEIVGLLMDKKT